MTNKQYRRWRVTTQSTWKKSDPGQLPGLGRRAGASTVRRVLNRLRIPPAPHRHCTTWRQFLRTQAATMLAAGFVTVDCAVTVRRV